VDLSCIISSGDLELYVLGMLPEEEMYKITQLAKLFPEVQAELDLISESLEGLGSVTAANLSAFVKGNLMSKLKQLKEEEKNSVSLDSTHQRKADEVLQTEAPVIPLHKNHKSNNYLAAASLIGLVICLGALIYFFNQNKRNQTELASLQQQVDTLHNNINVQQQQILAYSQTMEMMHDKDYMKIELKSVPGKPSAMAQVFWNTKTKYVYIANVSLPQAPSDKQYQLWAIVDGKPVDAGMLSDAKNLAQRMKVFETAEMFAITLEKKGGSPTPTMEHMYVAGKV